MSEGGRERKTAASALFISALMHAVLLVPFAIPNCSLSTPDDERSEAIDDRPPLAVEIVTDIPPPARKPPRIGNELCDPNARPEWSFFNIEPGLAVDRIFQAADPHFGQIMMAGVPVQVTRSRALRGWFRPIDAVRLLAGDVGACVSDWGGDVGIHPCHGSNVPFSRAKERQVRREWEPAGCTTPTLAPMPNPITV